MKSAFISPEWYELNVEALALQCPLCAVGPYSWCVSRRTGETLEWPHKQRVDSAELERLIATQNSGKNNGR